MCLLIDRIQICYKQYILLKIEKGKDILSKSTVLIRHKMGIGRDVVES